MRKNLIKKVQNTIFQYDLFSHGNKIVVGVSGGPDSVCLLHILHSLQKKYSLEIIVAHVNYGLRGKDSEQDEKFVRRLAEKCEMKIFVLHPTIALTPSPSPVIRRRGSHFSENSLRDIRYDFFERIRKENDFDLIAVAHNQDDQVETYLMRMIRGAGLAGLSSIRHKNGKIIRPLLNDSRKEILAYLKNNRLKYRLDKTNLESKFLRNKIRNRLIPFLEKEFNPQIRETISDSILSISQDQSFLQEFAEKIHKKNQSFEVSGLLKLHPAILRRVVLGAIRKKKGDLKDIESSHIKEIEKILKSTKNKRQIVSFKGLKVRRIGDKLIIEKT